MAEQAEIIEQPRLPAYQVILRPLVTEKGMHRSTRNNQYAFEVHLKATKDDVRRAVEELFNVEVDKVRTQNRRGKPRKHRFKQGQTKGWKKAIVTLNKEHRIDFF
ncbi:MAG: 50S ribosomal protein L23 [Planctomycetia bacterium]|jgi:large subunit ribosomal protein L23|nr:50S ribosomal protein L23 [Planctomycetia bacterium]